MLLVLLASVAVVIQWITSNFYTQKMVLPWLLEFMRVESTATSFSPAATTETVKPDLKNPIFLYFDN
jgi:hypothetical protein